MATIAELMVKIGAKDTELKRAFENSVKRGRKFVNDMGARLAKVTAVVAAAVTAAMAKILSMINQTAREIDVLAKTATKLGVGVGELQRLQFQAQLTGVSTETLNMALQRMVRRIAEAAKGTGEAVGALKELNIDAGELARLSPDKQFDRIAQSFQSVAQQGDKVRLAMKLFDSEGVALVNTLNSNLKDTNKIFDDLGVKLTDHQAKAVETFNDSKTKLDTVWEGFKQQVTANVAPALTEIVDKVVLFIQEMGGIDVVASKAAIGIIRAMQGVLSVIEKIDDAITSVINGFRILEIGAAKSAKLLTQIAPTAALEQGAALGGKISGVPESQNIGALLQAFRENADKRVTTLENEIAATRTTKTSTSDKFFNDLVSGLEKHATVLEKQVKVQEENVRVTGNANSIQQGFSKAEAAARRREADRVSQMVETLRQTGKIVQKNLIDIPRAQIPKIDVVVNVDENGITRKVVTTSGFNEAVKTETQKVMQNTARQVRR